MPIFRTSPGPAAGPRPDGPTVRLSSVAAPGPAAARSGIAVAALVLAVLALVVAAVAAGLAWEALQQAAPATTGR